MKISSLFLFLTLFRPVFGQDAAGAAAQAPPDVDQALRVRVAAFYQAYIDGKFSDAYNLVSPESQNMFIQSGKDEYKGCETTKIEYSENFSKAFVTETCKSIWLWHGHASPNVVPVESHWKLSGNLWYWYYVKPTFVHSPFSPTGIVQLPPDQPETNSGNVAIPKDMRAAALNILSKVNVDKTTVSLRADSASKDEVHVRNDMQGEINLVLAPSPIAGLKATASKTQLKAKETAAITIEYTPDDKSIACGDCASRIQRAWIQMTVEPTGQVFQIEVKFTNQKSEQFPLPKQ
jgi:hypothetical protein